MQQSTAPKKIYPDLPDDGQNYRLQSEGRAPKISEIEQELKLFENFWFRCHRKDSTDDLNKRINDLDVLKLANNHTPKD